MDEFFLNDLGFVCLAFWGILGFLLFWFLYKIKPLNDDGCNLQEFNQKETKNSLLESLKDKEEIDHQKENGLSNPEQIQDLKGERE